MMTRSFFQAYVRDWVRGSIATDSAGDPLRLFHGTDASFAHFDLAKTRNPDTEGGPCLADLRALASPRGARIVEAYVRICSPFRVSHRVWAAGGCLGVAALKSRGHDGIVIDGYSLETGGVAGTAYIPFVCSSQIVILAPQLEE